MELGRTGFVDELVTGAVEGGFELGLSMLTELSELGRGVFRWQEELKQRLRSKQ